MGTAGAAYTSTMERRWKCDRPQQSFIPCFHLHVLKSHYRMKIHHMETAFENANKEWATELMVLVADRILKLYDDDIPLHATIVTQENETILIDLSTCRLYSHHLSRIV